MAEIITQHSHCHICMKAIPFGETLCSEDCRQKYLARIRKSRIILYFMLGLFFAFTVVFILTNR